VAFEEAAAWRGGWECGDWGAGCVGVVAKVEPGDYEGAEAGCAPDSGDYAGAGAEAADCAPDSEGYAGAEVEAADCAPALGDDTRTP